MKDPDRATAAGDDSVETTSLKLTGLGEYAEFFIDGVHLANGVDGRTVDYNPADGGTYTITGLSQEDLNKLGFKQAKAALVDQDDDEAGIQIGVEAWTVESGNSAESAHVTDTLTLNISSQIATTGDDTLIWTGLNINGRAGEDTIQLRFGESLEGSELAAHLLNIEVIDLGIEGENQIEGLRVGDVLAMTDDRNTLKIFGNSEDAVSLDDPSAWTRAGQATEGDKTFNVYKGGEATLWVELGVQGVIID